MGLLKIISKTEADKDYLKNATEYITRNSETIYYGGVNICPERAYKQMRRVKKYYGKTSGNQLIHFIVCFNESVQDIGTAVEYSYRIAEYYKSKYQILFGIHSEVRSNNSGGVKSLIHVHFVVNTVSFKDGRMFAEGKGKIREFAEHISEVTGDERWKAMYSVE